MRSHDTVFTEVPVALVAPPPLDSQFVSLMKVSDATETPTKRGFSSITDPAYPLVLFDLSDIMHVKVNGRVLFQFRVLPTLWVLSSKSQRVNF